MSDFVSRDLLPELWEEILQRHWSFLETEESIQKLEEKKKLEDCLKEFLSVVPHDRKFFLPETSHVLRKTIREMDEFTAYKAIMGFEAISQYANNLFTKPWRKEFRTLKTYSGYYQHEVKSNLLDADKLLEAMGYQKISDTVLVLDGPICPDQVTNVSRDAMAAYVECQIMNNIYSGLLSMGINCSWKDIYHYRERHVGGTSQAIKGIAYALQTKPPPKETSFNSADDFYQQPVQTEVPKCSNCALYHMKSHNSQLALPTHLQQRQQMPCQIHGHNTFQQCAHGSMNISQHQMCVSGACGHQAQIPHSRSLEHYHEPHGMLPHRHSFDHHPSCIANHYQHIPSTLYHQHPQSHLYESPYDCIGGSSLGSSASYSIIPEGAVGTCPTLSSHPYNVSGNRVPLPFNISNQLNNHYSTPIRTSCNCKPPEGYVNVVENSYASIGKNYNPHLQNIQENIVAPIVPPPRLHSNTKDLQQQSTFPPEQLIDFDDRASLLKHDYSSIPANLASNIDYSRNKLPDHKNNAKAPAVPVRGMPNTIYAQPVVIDSDKVPTASNQHDVYGGNYGYAQPIPRSNRIKQTVPSNSSTTINDKQHNSMKTSEDLIDNNIQIQTELNTALNNMSLHTTNNNRKKDLSSRMMDRDTSDTCDSAILDDFVTVFKNSKSSPTQAVKNQDGVGSYESWNYVFRNLERNGYTKDLGDREDLLMQSLDLNTKAKFANPSSNSNFATSNSLDKKSRNSTGKASKPSNEKVQSLDRPLKPAITTPIIVNLDRSPTRGPSSTTSMQTQTNNGNSNSLGATKKILKSALKNSNKTTTIVENPLITISSTNNDNKNPNYNNSHLINNSSPSNHTKANKNSSSMGNSSSSSTKLSSTKPKQPPPVSTQVIVTKPNEWSCRFCTFLNPDTKRICDMCYRSKDFNLEASAVSHAPTCV